MPDSTKPAIKNLEKTKVGWDELGGKKVPKNFPLFLGGGNSQHGDFPKPLAPETSWHRQQIRGGPLLKTLGPMELRWSPGELEMF